VEKPLGPLLTVAKQAGFTEDSFKACLANQKVLDGIEWVRNRAADTFKVDSTPTFFINGQIAKRCHVDRRVGQAHRALSQELTTVFPDPGRRAGASRIPPAGTAGQQGLENPPLLLRSPFPRFIVRRDAADLDSSAVLDPSPGREPGRILLTLQKCQADTYALAPGACVK